MGRTRQEGGTLPKGFLHLKDKVLKCSYPQGKGHLNVLYLHRYKENTLPSLYRDKTRRKHLPNKCSLAWGTEGQTLGRKTFLTCEGARTRKYSPACTTRQEGHIALTVCPILKDETPEEKVFLSWRKRLQEGRHSQGHTYPEGRESKKEDIPHPEDKTPRKEDIPKDLLTLKDETPRRRTCLSWRTRPKKEDIPGDALILIRYPVRTRAHTQRRTHGPQDKKDIRYPVKQERIHSAGPTVHSTRRIKESE